MSQRGARVPFAAVDERDCDSGNGGDSGDGSDAGDGSNSGDDSNNGGGSDSGGGSGSGSVGSGIHSGRLAEALTTNSRRYHGRGRNASVAQGGGKECTDWGGGGADAAARGAGGRQPGDAAHLLAERVGGG